MPLLVRESASAGPGLCATLSPPAAAPAHAMRARVRAAEKPPERSIRMRLDKALDCQTDAETEQQDAGDVFDAGADARGSQHRADLVDGEDVQAEPGDVQRGEDSAIGESLGQHRAGGR